MDLSGWWPFDGNKRMSGNSSGTVDDAQLPFGRWKNRAYNFDGNDDQENPNESLEL